LRIEDAIDASSVNIKNLVVAPKLTPLSIMNPEGTYTFVVGRSNPPTITTVENTTIKVQVLHCMNKSWEKIIDPNVPDNYNNDCPNACHASYGSIQAPTAVQFVCFECCKAPANTCGSGPAFCSGGIDCSSCEKYLTALTVKLGQKLEFSVPKHFINDLSKAITTDCGGPAIVTL